MNSIGKYLTCSSFALLLGSIFAPSLQAQEKNLQGIVMQLDNSKVLEFVRIKNLSTMSETKTNAEGKFQLASNLYDKLSVEANGYLTDTIFVHDLGVNRIYLLPTDNAIILDEVMVARLTDSRLNEEIRKAQIQGKYVDATQYRPGIRISPSHMLGKDGKLARQNIKLLRKEKDIRSVDNRFTVALIRSLTPLTIEESLLFQQKYRPTLSFIQTASESQLQVYINDMYKKFKNK